MSLSKTSVLLFISLFLGHYAQSQNKAVDVQHYRFEIAVNDTTDVIQGIALVQYISTKKSDQVYFYLASQQADTGKGMKVTAVKSAGKSLNFHQERDKLYIKYAKPVKKGQEKALTIIYHGIPADGLIISKNQFGGRTFFADNWPERARNWIPTNDHPSDKASVDFVIIAPSHYQVVANGVKVEETSLPEKRRLTHWSMKKELPTKIMAVGIADFAVEYDTVINKVSIQNWVFAKNRDAGFKQYRYSKYILPFFEHYIAPFPYKKLANVQSKTRFGGLENASNIFYSAQSISPSPTKDDLLELEALMAHETAHQWFGDQASETDWQHLWLSEGFATYLTDLYLKDRYGDSLFKKRMKKERQTVLHFYSRRQTPIVDTAGKKNPMQLLNPNTYQKGAWVLHMLRLKLGDVAFRTGLQAYYKKYKGGNASTADFKKVMEKTAQQNLDRFFEQWLHRAGQPEIEGTWHYDKSSGKLRLHILQKQDEAFEFPLRLKIERNGKSLLKQIVINAKTTDKKLSVPFEPTKITLDPEVELLYEGNLRKSN